MPKSKHNDLTEGVGDRDRLSDEELLRGPALAPRHRTSSFSILRVGVLVVVAVLLITPALYVLAEKGLFDNELTCAASTGIAHAGSTTRAVTAFDLQNSIVPQDEILSGGPPKDGIPALSNPEMLAAHAATYLSGKDRVIGVSIGNEARAYPLRILNYHEVVNDQIAKAPIAVAYCPLCDSASVFERTTPRGEREFGVSGLLYNSNVLLYDRDKSESLWSQLKNRAVAGVQAKSQLALLPLELTTWQEWQARYPDTTVLSNRTGHVRDYDRSPYASYFANDRLMFPVDRSDDRLPPKEKVLGVIVGDSKRAYPASSFSTEYSRFEDEVDGHRVVLEFNPETQSLRVVEAGPRVTWMYSLWFSWYAMHPETEIFR